VTITFEPAPSPSPSVSDGQGQPEAASDGTTLRVIDDTQSQGLLESILGGVARAFGL
jgi:hypothetical protein